MTAQPVSTADDVADTILVARGLTKRYGPHTALDNLDVDLKVGEVLGLIGQNGAGKSTLLKLMTGVEQPDQGTLKLRGRPIVVRSVADAGRQGIGIVFQEQSLVTNLTVAENILLGRESGAMHGGIVNWRKMRAEAQKYLNVAGSAVSPSELVERLSFAERQSVELAKVLALEDRVDGPLVILFDEPTSVLSGGEIESLFAQIRRLKTRAAIVFVSHRMDEVLTISDRVIVMRDGGVVAEHRAHDVAADDLHRLMVGSERAEDYYHRQTRVEYKSAPILLKATGLGRQGAFAGIDLELHAGEVIGIAGVIGSGREALCRALFGAAPATKGSIVVAGRRRRIQTPAQAVRHGIGLVPAERRVEGMVAGRSIAENMMLPGTPALSWHGIARKPSREHRLVAEWIERLKIKTASPATDIARLSGGNQQKVVLAKWLVVPQTKILILDHPTRGLDVGAKGDVYAAIRSSTRSGMGVVLLSDTLEELTGLADTVLVMRDGEETGRFDLDENPPSHEELVKLMV